MPDYAAALTGDVRLRLAVPRRSLEGTVDDEVAAAFSAALDVLRGRGATVVEIDLPHAAQAMAVYYVLVMAEASSNLARYDGVRYGTRVPAAGDPALDEMYRETRSVGFGAEVTRRVMLGTYVLSAGYYDAYYRKAQQARTLIARDYAAAFAGADAVLTPTSPTAAFRLGERVDDPVAMYRSDVLTVGPSLADLPAASVPCGFTAAGLPLGLPDWITEGHGQPARECGRDRRRPDRFVVARFACDARQGTDQLGPQVGRRVIEWRGRRRLEDGDPGLRHLDGKLPGQRVQRRPFLHPGRQPLPQERGGGTRDDGHGASRPDGFQHEGPSRVSDDRRHFPVWRQRDVPGAHIVGEDAAPAGQQHAARVDPAGLVGQCGRERPPIDAWSHDR